jgi:DNA-binding transcriptional LysR family regulator
VELEADQRWTVSQVATSVLAAGMGLGYGWYAEERIRSEIDAGSLKPLPLGEGGGERFVQLYLVFADRDNAGPGTVRLATLIEERVAAECDRQTSNEDHRNRRQPA